MYTPREPHDRYDYKRGITYRTEGRRTFINWSPQMLYWLRRYFATTLNDELAGQLGVSKRTMLRKAAELNLTKDKKWLTDVWNERRLMAHASAKRKGYPGCFKPGCKVGEKYWFKKKEQL